MSGKQIFKNVLGKTQAEVKEKLQKALVQAKKIDFAKTGKYTVTMWMNEWFENNDFLADKPIRYSGVSI